MIATVAQAGLGGYVILYLAVAASWIGIPILGAGALAAAGVLASDGELSIWLVILVATLASWTGGYVGYRLGWHASQAVVQREGRWQRERRRTVAAGERLYRRWGRLAVFVTPTWVSGALKMPRRTFLIWNALAALLSTCIAALGAYGIGTAVLGQLSAKRGTLALALAACALLALVVALIRRKHTTHQAASSRGSPPSSGVDRQRDLPEDLPARPSKTSARLRG